MKLLSLAAVMSCLMFQAAETNRNGSVEGTVTRYGSSDPIGGVAIALWPDGSTKYFDGEITTDDKGHFVLEDVIPGKYVIRAMRGGYVNPSPNGVRLQDGGSAKAITVKPGLRLTDLSLTLSTGSVIAGRVIDESGKPVLSISIKIQAASPEHRAPRVSFQSDDRGEYRIFDLEAGRYTVSASNYFLGSSEISVDVPEGSVLSGVDLVVRPGGKKYKVSGLLMSTGLSLQNKVISEMYLVPDPLPKKQSREVDSNGGYYSLGFQSSESTTAGSGLNFSFAGIPSGNYHMLIEARNSTKREDCCDIIASSDLRLLDRDVTDLRLSASGNDVHGRIKVIGDPEFHPTLNLSLAMLPDDIRSRKVQPDGMGTFVIPSVISGRWKLQIANLPRDAAVVDVLQSSSSVFDGGFSIEDKTPEPLEVLLSPAGSI